MKTKVKEIIIDSISSDEWYIPISIRVDENGIVRSSYIRIRSRTDLRYSRQKFHTNHKIEENLRIREWAIKHPESGRKRQQKHRKTLKYLHTRKAWRNSVKGFESERKYAAKRRQLDFIPLNQKFENSEAHHIDKEHVIYIPKKLHHSISHNVFTGKNMDILFNKIIKWMIFDLIGNEK